MEAAAHTPGGYGGVPQSVGKEFVAADRHDEEHPEPYGNVTYADPGYRGKKRYPIDTPEHVRAAASYFAKTKDRDEYSPEQRAKIEKRIKAAEAKHGIGEDRKDAEDYDVDGPELTDHETAEAIRDGELPSPQRYQHNGVEFWLFDLRITGTGMAWREALGEWAFRDPETWTSPAFVERCNGLAVVMIHPDSPGLNTEEFRDRSIGSIVLPYVKGEEVWGIAKIFDADAAEMMQHTHRSTSPGVTAPKGAQTLSLENGDQVLDEGLPQVLDHLAICQAGVWDKDGPPEGVRLDSLIGKGEVVTDEEKKALEKERDDAKIRADAAEKERDELKKEREDRKRSDEEREREDKKRHDESEKEREEKEREDARKDAHRLDAKRKDARHKHHDAKKHDGDFMDCARCDSDKEEIEKALAAGEEEEKHQERALEDKRRKDAAAREHEVEAERGTEIKDAKIAEMAAQIAALQRGQQPLSIEERNEVASAYHRYDNLYQMLADAAPQPAPGEKPIEYRKRCANGIRKYTKGFQNYVFHDAQQAMDFGLVENAMFAEALEYAKNPPQEQIAGRVLAIKDTTTLPGKVITKFVGDQSAVWAPFKQPVQKFLKRVNTQPHLAAH